MKIQVLSDLHLEDGGDLPDHHPEADVIVLAGDLVPYTEGLVELLAEYWSTAPNVLYVFGNNEFYRTEIDDARAKLAEECAKARIHLLDPGTIRIEGVRFIGATLWTDFELDGPTRTAASHVLAQRGVSDFIVAIFDVARPTLGDAWTAARAKLRKTALETPDETRTPTGRTRAPRRSWTSVGRWRSGRPAQRSSPTDEKSGR